MSFDLNFFRTLPRGYPPNGIMTGRPVGYDPRIQMR